MRFQDITVDPTTGAVVVRATFPNPNGVLLPGLYVRARLTEGVLSQGLLAPQAGITRNERGEAVGPGGRAGQRRGAAHGRDRAGDRRQVADQERLKPGDQIDRRWPAQPSSWREGNAAGRGKARRAVSRFFIDRPIFAWVIALGMILAGIFSIRRCPSRSSRPWRRRRFPVTAVFRAPMPRRWRTPPPRSSSNR